MSHTLPAASQRASNRAAWDAVDSQSRKKTHAHVVWDAFYPIPITTRLPVAPAPKNMRCMFSGRELKVVLGTSRLLTMFLGQSATSSNKVSRAAVIARPGNPDLAAEYDKFIEELAVLRASTSAAAVARCATAGKRAAAVHDINGASAKRPKPQKRPPHAQGLRGFATKGIEEKREAAARAFETSVGRFIIGSGYAINMASKPLFHEMVGCAHADSGLAGPASNPGCAQSRRAPAQ